MRQVDYINIYNLFVSFPPSGVKLDQNKMKRIHVIYSYRKELWLPDQWQIQTLLQKRKQQERAFFTSETLAACLTQCLKGDGWNADKSISMLGRKPQMLRLCPLAAVAMGFPHKASGSGEEPDRMSATRTQFELWWAEGQRQPMKMLLGFGSEPIPQIKCHLISSNKKQSTLETKGQVKFGSPKYKWGLHYF